MLADVQDILLKEYYIRMRLDDILFYLIRDSRHVADTVASRLMNSIKINENLKRDTNGYVDGRVNFEDETDKKIM